YDTGFITNRKTVLIEWMKDMNIDSVLRLKEIRIEENGSIAISFAVTSLKNKRIISEFLKQYNFAAASEKFKSNLYSDFAARLFFCISSIFRVPPDKLILSMEQGSYEA